MSEIREYESVVNKDLIKEFGGAKECACTDLFTFALRKCSIDGIIAAANFLCPDMVCVRGYVFIKAFLGNETNADDILRLIEDCGSDKKSVEMRVNTWSIGDFFVGSKDPLLDNERALQAFGEVIVYFWKRRAKELFPDKNITVELGNNLEGEYGPCVTMYEERLGSS